MAPIEGYAPGRGDARAVLSLYVYIVTRRLMPESEERRQQRALPMGWAAVVDISNGVEGGR
jgi:hypothetical protein